MSDLKQQLRTLDLAQAPDVWPDASSRIVGPLEELDQNRRHRGSRIATAAVAIAVFVAAAVFSWQALRPGATTVGSSSPTPPPGMALYTDPLGWTAFYPSQWSATTLHPSDGLGVGVRIQDLAYLERGPLQDEVVLTITHPIDATTDPSAGSSSFPLSAGDFKLDPGPMDTSGLRFTIDGVDYSATLHVGSAAREADVTAMDEVIASIRPPSAMPGLPISYASAPDLAAVLHDAGPGCDRLGDVRSILQPGIDVRSCLVNGETVWLWVYQTPEAMRSFPKPISQNSGGVWNVRGPNWLVATTSGAAATTVQQALGGDVLGGDENKVGGSGYWISFPDAPDSVGESPDGAIRIVALTNLPDGTLFGVNTDTSGMCCSAVKDGKMVVEESSSACDKVSGAHALGTAITITTAADIGQHIYGVPVGSQPPQQPDSVLDILGPHFENLTGDQVVDTAGAKSLIAATSYAWPQPLCLEG